MTSRENPRPLEGIAIVGVAARLPDAHGTEQFWKNLCAGKESVRSFSDSQLVFAGEDTAIVLSSNYVKSGVPLEGIEMFDADFFGLSPREASLTDPQHRVFLESAWEALEDAGYDPNKTQLRIGVFAGTGPNNYLLHNLISNPGLMKSLLDLQSAIASDKDYLATRVSYKLNLKGPSLTVQTACSTSLTATHLACQSLLNGECDMALAGAVSIRIPQVAGYVHQKGSILSPDGHCRPFDAAAEGTVIGSGAAIVVLKRLEDALRDGDSIRAVIRGSAVNNDGGEKIGYTAPSLDGQATVVAEAQAIAGVTADEISYVEAHGTGTILGDPIEVAALTKAFRRTTSKKGFCAIGTVKSNVGHLDAAAGITGLIKVVLALENRKLPPSINFSRPNPAIDFANSPFYVQQDLADWQPAQGTRIAGISSFGIGGTNVHLIVEEAPPVSPSDSIRLRQLLTISARSPVALEKAAARLADCLSNHPELNLADVAYTLQQGRRSFPYRRTVTAKNTVEAAAVLRSRNPSRLHSGKAFEGKTSVAFLFPAQGVQHVNMGRELYETESVFRENVDRCVEHLHPVLGQDLRELLYPSEERAQEAAQLLGQTRFTQPAVFTIEYALAQLWMSWGIVPSAMLGHSLGEYVAATISGVFDLKDALELVAERGRLMQKLSPGKMLAVHLSEQELQSWLAHDVCLAAANAPQQSVVSGPTEAIERLEMALRAARVETHTLQTSHAFHSAMMEPIVAPLVEKIAGYELHEPRIPFASTLTGTWITPEEAVDPKYWGRQARCPVRFSSAVLEVLKTPDQLLLEVGPGNTLTALTRLHLNSGLPSRVQNSLRQSNDHGADYECMLTALGSLWISGVEADWAKLYMGEHRRRVPLPAYPFERKRFWIDVPQKATGSGDSPNSEFLSGDAATRAPAEVVGTRTAFTLSLDPPTEIEKDYEPPRTDAESALAKIWHEVLGVKNVGIHDDFFELGGDSLLAVNLMMQIERQFGSCLPLASLIQCPTIEKLARILAHKEAVQPDWSPLVGIQTRGSGTPFFCVHGAGGNVLMYRALAQHLGDKQPFYGLQARGLDGKSAPLTRIEDIAELYVQEIRRVQPRGPYYLGGYCMGGTIALEMAQQLKSSGDEVALLAFFDTVNWLNVAPDSILSKANFHVQRLAYHAGNLLLLDFRGKVRFFTEKLRVARSRVPVWRSMLFGNGHAQKTESETSHMAEVWVCNDRAAASYVPRFYSGVVTHFQPQKRYSKLARPEVQWTELVEREETVILPVYPAGMLLEPFVKELASALEQAIARAGEQPRQAFFEFAPSTRGSAQKESNSIALERL